MPPRLTPRPTPPPQLGVGAAAALAAVGVAVRDHRDGEGPGRVEHHELAAVQQPPAGPDRKSVV